MDKILSVIIPTYNMEAYLRKCLDSLIVDDELVKLLEVLVINDGSTDNSSTIAHDYEKEYPETFRVIDKENGHYGSCVNRGLKEASGKYVKILDADDYFDNHSFRLYLRLLQDADVDFVLTDYNGVNENGRIRRTVTYQIPNDVVLLVDDYCGGIVFSRLQMHAITYKRSILLENKYHQTEGLPYTDQEWMFLPITYMHNFIYFKYDVYQYLVGRKGQSIEKEQVLKMMESRFALVYKMIDIYNQTVNSTINQEKRIYLKNRLLICIFKKYKMCLLEHLYSENKLIAFENRLISLNKELYEEIPLSGYGRYYGQSFIGYWRTKHKVSNSVILLSIIIRICQYFNNLYYKF